jgi:hypothetical protein
VPDALSAPLELALRRLRARRWRAVGGALAVAGAVGLLLTVSVLGALAREESARGRVADLPARERLVQVTVRVVPDVEPVADPDPAIRDGDRALAGLGLGRPATVLVAGPMSPSDERGTRVVHVAAAGVTRRASGGGAAVGGAGSSGSPGAPAVDGTRVVSGRPPRSCEPRRCEVLTLSFRPAVGDRVRLGRMRARVVGRAALVPELAPPGRVLHGRAVLVGDPREFEAAAGRSGIWVVSSAAVRPGAVPGTALADLAARLRVAAARAERARPGVAVATPAERLEAIDRRARAAQRRLLLVGAQGAALFLAFAALLGVARRPEAEALDVQLRGLGASRWQPAIVRLVEISAPAVAGAAAALAVAAGGAAWTGARRDIDGFLAAALPLDALALVAALLAGAIAAEHVAARPGPVTADRRLFGPLEVAALACLAAVVWQALATGGLDASQVEGGDAAPVLLLVPGLALFAGGVAVARALPYGFRLAERVARLRSVPARLALLSLTRGGGIVAAATTFLALSLGGALFALDYRATLRGQLDAQAAFAAGTSWRVSAPDGVAPLTRLAGVTLERPLPAIRQAALVSPGTRFEDAREATLLALPGGAVPATQGWRPPADLDRRLRTGARPSGPRLDDGALELRLWLRATISGTIVAELLLPGDAFARLPLGDAVAGRWVRVRGRVPPRLHGAELVGLTLSSLLAPRPIVLDAGPLEQRTHAGWSVLDDLRSWRVAAGRFGDQGIVAPITYERGPVRRGVVVDIPESDAPLLRPGYRVPEEIPALASEALAAIAVDRRLTAMVRGRPLPIRIVATSERLPTVTRRPDRFLLVDYDTLLAVVTAQRPGEALPTEAWFDGPPPAGRPPYPDAAIVSRARATATARRDALASGASATLAVTAALAGALAAAGLLLAAASLLRAERGELAGWRALGAGPGALARVVRLRVVALYVAGALAALIGAALALRLVVALVAVTAGAGDPLPPIAIRIDWLASAALVAATGAIAAAVAAVVARAVR